MNERERSFRDELRGAFDEMTRPPHAGLGAQIRDELYSRPARSRGPRFAALLAAALGLIVIVGLLATGRMAVKVPLRGPVPASRPTHSQTPSPLPSGVSTAGPPAVGPGTPGTPAAGFSCAEASGGGTGQARVTGVRTGVQSGYDRFVIQFDGPVPQYDVQAQSGSTFVQDASGISVTLQGSSGLLVVLRNTSSSGSYSGPTDLHPNGKVIREARQVGDFEGVVHWGLGLSQPSCYRITTLSNPSRLVIDVQT